MKILECIYNALILPYYWFLIHSEWLGSLVSHNISIKCYLAYLCNFAVKMAKPGLNYSSFYIQLRTTHKTVIQSTNSLFYENRQLFSFLQVYNKYGKCYCIVEILAKMRTSPHICLMIAGLSSPIGDSGRNAESRQTAPTAVKELNMWIFNH